MAVPPHILPMQPTPLIGRAREIRAVCDLLLHDHVRLVTLTGPGGIGKTRLGLQVAAELLDRFHDGAMVVELAPIVDPNLVVTAIAKMLGVRDTGSRPLLESLKGHLRETRRLLLLDNFEQVLAAGPAVSDLLGACAGLKVLVTSRSALRLRGEHEYPVPTLPLPERGHGVSAREVAAYPAIDLFVQCATQARPDFTVTDENAAEVAEICRRLDGLPLAIELAAARVKLFPLRALLGRLERGLQLLTGGPRDAPARQRTLRDTIAWSYDLLDEADRRLFRRLAVFVGGCTIEAAEAVCDADQGLGVNILDGIASLVDKSLLRQEGGPDGESRFTMLETIREYGLELLEASGETTRTRHRHAAYSLRLAEQVDSELWGPDQVALLHRLEAELGNFRSALTWALGTGDDAATALRLGSALVQFWTIRGHLGELVHLEAALDATRREPDDVEIRRTRARALYRLAFAIRYRNDQERCVTLGRESVDLFRSIEDWPGLAAALSNLAFMLRDLPDYAAARAAAEEGMRLAREAGDWRFLGWALYILASVIWFDRYRNRGALTPLARDVDADADRDAADDEALATSLLDESLAIYRQHGVTRHVAIALSGGGGVGMWAWARGDFARAEAAYAEAIELHWRMGSSREVADCLLCFGRIALGQGMPRRSARLFGAADAAYEASRTRFLPTVWPQPEHDAVAARARIGDEAFESAFAEGRTLSLELAIAYALRRADPFQDASMGTADPTLLSRDSAALTAREREVAVLVGRGYSNRRIAEKTAEVHVRNIREKLGLQSRAQIAAWVAQHGLLSPTTDPSPAP